MANRILLIALFGLTACASAPQGKRTPAAQTQLGGSSNQVFSVLQEINQKPNLMFSKIKAIRIENSLVEVDLGEEGYGTNTLRFRTSETKCNVSECPLQVEQIK